MSSYLGQNFLIDQNIVQGIVDTIQALYSDSACKTIVEIGPGQGALTKRIVSIPGQLLCIEKDSTMQRYLDPLCKKNANMQVLYEDVLEVDSEQLDSIQGPNPINTLTLGHFDTLIVGNLPYYITSPILRKFFECQEPTRAGGVFLIQKEVADKIVRNAQKKSFLRRLINYAYRVEYCFSVPPTAFKPAPKVTSAVIRLLPKTKDDTPSLDFAKMIEFLDLYSPFKRKTLGASSKIVLKHEGEGVFCIPEDLSGKRLEELGWEEMTEIVKS